MLEQSLAVPLLGPGGASLSRGVHGFVEALGGHASLAKALPSDRVTLAHVAYDAANLLGALPGMRRAPASRLGCSSLVVLPRSSRTRHLLHGRNFDLPPLGDEHPPLVCVHRPRDGLAHVSLHHGGGYTPGITATNEAGLTVGVHQNATRRTSLSGSSVLVLAEALIESCASLTEAIALLHRHKSASGWTFVISDARQGRTAAIEIDADGPAVLFPRGPFLAVANCYRTSKEVYAYASTGAVREHNWCRLARLNQLAREHHGVHDAATLALALGDSRDAYDLSRHRPCGNVVAALHNLDAWVVSPSDDTLHVAVGRAPRNTSRGYVGFRLSSLFAGRVETVAGLDTSLGDRGFRRGLDAMAAAARLHFEENDVEGTLGQLADASVALPHEPMIPLLRGAMALRLGDNDGAAALLEGCVEQESSPYRRGLAALLEGHAAASRGHRAAARAHYQRVPVLAGDVDPLLLRRARRAEQRGFSRTEGRRLVPDIVFGDVV